MGNKPNYFLLSLLLLPVYWAAAVSAAIILPLDEATHLFEEAGFYEQISPWFWFLLAACCLMGKFRKRTLFATAATAVLFGMREMDLHKTLFDISFLKSRFYLGNDIPFTDKLTGAALVAIIAYLLFYLSHTLWRTFKAAPCIRLTHYRYILLAALMLAASKVLDRTNALAAEWGWHLSDRAGLIIQSLEESSEALVPVVLICAICAYRQYQGLSEKQ